MSKTRRLAVLIIFCIALALLLCACMSRETRIEHQITDPSTIAELDREFASFIGAGHILSQYTYVDFPLVLSSRDAMTGYGPLFQFGYCEIIVGTNGKVAVISYGTLQKNTWHLSPIPTPNASIFVLVLQNCVAPQAWWGHPVTPNYLSSNGLDSDFCTYIPWPDEIDFDHPPEGYVLDGDSWYWNGEAYVLATVVRPDSHDPSISVRSKGPLRGLFAFFGLSL